MTLGIAVGVYVVVHMLGAYLLRASGVAQDLFGRFRDVPDLPEPMPLAESTDFIENHSFWDIEPDQDFDDIEEAFWGQLERHSG